MSLDQMFLEGQRQCNTEHLSSSEKNRNEAREMTSHPLYKHHDAKLHRGAELVFNVKAGKRKRFIEQEDIN